MLSFPPPLTPRSFLAQHWQKTPLFMPGGLPVMRPVIDADEMAWLATQPDVESRLVFTEHGPRGTRYRVQHGPFDERRLSRLPKADWTLLVHDVDKHLPVFRGLFDATPFIPDWRIDDLMVSVAAPGGSVGPHRDQYDVFLCQATGIREWHLGQPGEAVTSRRGGPLALLEPFESPAPLMAGPTDVLYLPPTVPHWGIARELCVTGSLGMRAPTCGELADALQLAGHGDMPGRAAEEVDSFYTDPDLLPDESAQAGMITERALERAARLPGLPAISRELLARAFGTLVTTPKDSLVPERPDDGEIGALAAQVARSEHTRVHGMARLAWCETDPGPALVFVNGSGRQVNDDLLVEFRHLCAARSLSASRCSEWSKNGAGAGFLRWLVASGTFDLIDTEM